MSSRKDLKKLINNSMDTLYNDIILYKVFTKNADADKADELIKQIADSHNDFISRISTTEGKDVKGRTKAYYTKLKNDLKTSVDKFGQDIQSLS